MYIRPQICAILIGVIALNFAEGAVSPEQMEKTANGLRNSCISKSGADPELAAGIRRGQFSDDYKVQCYTQCVMKTLRTFKNGRLDLDMMNKQIDTMLVPEDGVRVKKAMKECYNEVSNDDPCTLAYLFVKCNYEKDPDVYFFP